MEKSDLPCQVFVHLLMKGSGLKDSNFQVCVFFQLLIYSVCFRLSE